MMSSKEKSEYKFLTEDKRELTKKIRRLKAEIYDKQRELRQLEEKLEAPKRMHDFYNL
jgi:peptidoglycan hydrolase CwlO-like protein